MKRNSRRSGALTGKRKGKGGRKKREQLQVAEALINPVVSTEQPTETPVEGPLSPNY